MNQDDDLEALIEITAQLQLEDIQIWRASQKGKTREGGRLSDAEVSFNAMEAEHKATLQRAKDRRIARGLERAVTQDIDLIRVMAAIEAQERSDRQIALALSDTANTRPPAQTTASQIWAVPTQIRSPSTNSTTSLPTSSADSVNTFLSSLITNSSRTSVAESLNSTRTSVAPGFIPPILKLAGGRATADCVICGEAATAAYHAPCGCFYDRDCLTELFQKATVDESLFPPRCCNQQILFQNVRSVFSPQLIRAFEEKTEEFKTTNRLYCHNPICSAFIGPAVGSERTRENKACTRCARHTCSFCKGPGHPTYMTCPIDAGAQQVLALGRQEGWQSCPSCHHMVELELGCYHMTCRCRHQFCYLCSQEWKSCTCPQWDENRLIVSAQGRVMRQHGPLPPAPRPAQINERTTEVFRMANQLRANHQCAHHTFGFAKLNGAGSCESCGRQSREFLLRCRGCSIQVCVHCRRNRL